MGDLDPDIILRVLRRMPSANEHLTGVEVEVIKGAVALITNGTESTSTIRSQKKTIDSLNDRLNAAHARNAILRGRIRILKGSHGKD
jgi:hypothetical protein